MYDSANRLTQLTTKGTGAPASTGGPATDETFNLTYDINGNMKQKSKADGSDTTTYTWDSQNRLTALTRTGQSSVTASFKYDMGNRRIEKTINGETVKFIYDGDQIVGEQKSDGTTTSVLAGLAIDEMIARYSNGQQSTYLTDALGSVIAQLKDDQTVQNQYGYSPYGMTTKGSNGIVDANVDDKQNASQYTGRENDGTGLYYYRNRYYMASCGRFVSEDPIGLNGGMNLYAYVGGDPVNNVDPLGLATCDIDAARQVVERRLMPPMRPNDFTKRKPYDGKRTQAGAINSPTEGIMLNERYYDLLPSSIDPRFTADRLLETIIHEYGHSLGWQISNVYDHNKFGRFGDPKYYEKVDAYVKVLKPFFDEKRQQLCNGN